MLLKLNLSLCLNTVCLGKPLTQSRDSFVDIPLKFHRVVQGALCLKGFLVFPEILVYRRGAYHFQLFRCFFREVKGRPEDDVLHLLPHEGGQNFPAFIPEERPDQTEGNDGLIGIDSFSRAIRGSLLFRIKLHRPAIPAEQDFPNRFAA
jgi:hypothetical protein